MRSAGALLLLGLLAVVACATPPPSERLAKMYAESEDEVRLIARASDVAKLARAQNARMEAVREIVEAGEAVTTLDRMYAASILKTSRDVEDLELAEELAFSAAKDGDDRALRIAAEAIDCRLIEQGRPQKYGTQYGLDPVTRRWFLHPWDPSTTDVERRSMGVPSLAESRRRLEVLNAR